MVTQHNTLDRSLRAGDVLYWHCRYFNHSRRESRARAQELLDLFDLADRRGERIAALSGGLARRLQLAAAIAHDPALIVLDEPTTGLDPGSRRALWENVRELADAVLEHPDRIAPGQLSSIDGVTHVAREAESLRIFARHRAGLIAEVSAPLLAAACATLR